MNDFAVRESLRSVIQILRQGSMRALNVFAHSLCIIEPKELIFNFTPNYRHRITFARYQLFVNWNIIFGQGLMTRIGPDIVRV